MSDGGDFEKLETYSREPRLSHSDLTRWFMSHALRQYSGRNLTILKHVVRDTKALHEDFMESPTIGFCVFRCIQMSNKDVIVCLLEEGLRPNLYFHGRTMLHEAVRISNKAMVLFLLSLPWIDKNAYDDQYRTALMYAAKGKPQCLQVLLEAGCDLNMMDRSQNTAFHMAFHAPQAHRDDITACLDFLRHHGADINRRGAKGKTCLQRAIESNTHWLLAWLIHNNCDLNSPINHNARMNPFYALETKRFYNFTTPFLLACQLKNRMFVEVLISVGCDFRQHRWLLEYSRPVRYLNHSLTQAFLRVDSLRLCCRKVLRRCLSTNIIAESCQLGLPRPLRCFLLCHAELRALGSTPDCDSCSWRTHTDEACH